ncbi:hypothetical protein R1flu_024023 [Riccia fluitans]|uniref:Uncharacterized protein n=1 Tax=Riccia fluitans TaxID=41844 RepID=A0ABD1XWL9_9MARC
MIIRGKIKVNLHGLIYSGSFINQQTELLCVLESGTVEQGDSTLSAPQSAFEFGGRESCNTMEKLRVISFLVLGVLLHSGCEKQVMGQSLDPNSPYSGHQTEYTRPDADLDMHLDEPILQPNPLGGPEQELRSLETGPVTKPWNL